MHNVLSSSSRRGQSDVPSHSCISVRQTLLCGQRTVDPEQTARMRKVAAGEDINIASENIKKFTSL